MFGLKINKEISILNILTWIVATIIIVWTLSAKVSAADGNFEKITTNTTNIETVKKLAEINKEDLIKVKSEQDNQKQMLDAIKKDTDYLRKRLDRLIEKIQQP